MNLHNLAVMFRTLDVNLGHCSVYDAMHEAGLAYIYGVFRSIPKRHWRKRRQMANAIANELSRRCEP